MNRIYVIGLGAIGGLVASKIYDLDPRLVRVIAGPERAARLRARPLTVNGRAYPFEFAVAGAPADLVIVAVKHHQLPQAIEDMRPYVGPGTVILSLMNGISSEEVLGDAFGPGHLLYGYGVGMSVSRVGNTVECGTLGRIVFGEKVNDTLSPRVAEIKALFDKAGYPCEVPRDMLRAQWMKFMMNVGINQVSMILRAPYGTFVNNQDAWALLEAASREVMVLSQYCGVNLGQSDLDSVKGIIAGLSPGGTTSMLQDREAGRQTEVDMFAGVVVDLGKKYGVPTPVNETLLRIIRYLDGASPHGYQGAGAQ